MPLDPRQVKKDTDYNQVFFAVLYCAWYDGYCKGLRRDGLPIPSEVEYAAMLRDRGWGRRDKKGKYVGKETLP